MYEGRPPKILKYTVGTRSAGDVELKDWDRHLEAISEVTNISLLCNATREAIFIEGTKIANDGARLKFTVTASGGGGKIGGFSESEFWAYTGR